MYKNNNHSLFSSNVESSRAKICMKLFTRYINLNITISSIDNRKICSANVELLNKEKSTIMNINKLKLRPK